ncbi:hypothetical protein JOM56_010291 [Amanita muscaria]
MYSDHLVIYQLRFLFSVCVTVMIYGVISAGLYSFLAWKLSRVHAFTINGTCKIATLITICRLLQERKKEIECHGALLAILTADRAMLDNERKSHEFSSDFQKKQGMQTHT